MASTEDAISAVHSGILCNFETTQSKLSPTEQYMVPTAKYCLYPFVFPSGM
jgi:hypothetical protein